MGLYRGAVLNQNTRAIGNVRQTVDLHLYYAAGKCSPGHLVEAKALRQVDFFFRYRVCQNPSWDGQIAMLSTCLAPYKKRN